MAQIHSEGAECGLGRHSDDKPGNAVGVTPLQAEGPPPGKACAASHGGFSVRWFRESRLGPVILAIGWLAASPAPAAEGPTAGFLRPQMAVAAPAGFGDTCSRYAWACAGSNRSAAISQASFQVIRRINQSVNQTTRQISDIRQYRRAEYWALPTRAGGDCEDIALLKKQELIRAGVDPGRLLLATALDRRRRSHAVLILRTNRGDYVLDNLTSQIRPWRETGYIFLRMQDPAQPSRWIAVLAGGSLDAQS